MITLIIQISTHSNKAKWSFTLCAVGCLQYTEMWLMSTHTCHTHTDLYVICDRFQSQLVFLNLAIICFGLTDVSLCCEFMTSYRVLLVSLIFWVVSCLYCWWILVVTCFFGICIANHEFWLLISWITKLRDFIEVFSHVVMSCFYISWLNFLHWVRFLSWSSIALIKPFECMKTSIRKSYFDFRLWWWIPNYWRVANKFITITWWPSFIQL